MVQLATELSTLSGHNKFDLEETQLRQNNFRRVTIRTHLKLGYSLFYLSRQHLRTPSSSLVYGTRASFALKRRRDDGVEHARGRYERNLGSDLEGPKQPLRVFQGTSSYTMDSMEPYGCKRCAHVVKSYSTTLVLTGGQGHRPSPLPRPRSTQISSISACTR